VRSAEDGFSALFEIQQEVPDIVLSDLNMSRMSGFEFVSVVRRRFPAIQVIAMCGVFSGDDVPSAIAAAAFYEKGPSLSSLLQIVQVVPRNDCRLSTIQRRRSISTARNSHDVSGKRTLLLGVPETFPHWCSSDRASIRGRENGQRHHRNPRYLPAKPNGAR
jgi:DNA-binding NtrC family response regulator